MKLYHYSNIDTNELAPAKGASRHNGEDERAVGKAVVWFSDNPMRSTPPKEFEYTVEVESSDLGLYRDELFARGMDALAKQFASAGGFRWYWLERPIKPLEKRRWSAATRSYEPVP